MRQCINDLMDGKGYQHIQEFNAIVDERRTLFFTALNLCLHVRFLTSKFYLGGFCCPS